MNYRYQPDARADYIDLANYFDDSRRDYGTVFAQRMREFIARILVNPQLYGQVKRSARAGCEGRCAGTIRSSSGHLRSTS